MRTAIYIIITFFTTTFQFNDLRKYKNVALEQKDFKF